MTLLRGTLDAIIGEDEAIGGKPFTRLLAPLSATETTTATVESVLRFGEWKDGANNALLLINGELIYAGNRTPVGTFSMLTRGFGGTEPAVHPEGSLVYDASFNASALDHLRRGFLVEFAVGEDLDVIGRNLGLNKCVGLTEDQWREVIQALAYLPKGPLQAFREALNILWGPTNYALLESPASPWKVRVDIVVPPGTNLRGRFLLNSNEPALTTGTNTVDVDYEVRKPVAGNVSILMTFKNTALIPPP